MKPRWDRFDIVEAWYLYAVLWHGGQSSKEYKILGRLSRMKFRPRCDLIDEDSLEENGRMIYDSLVDSPQKVRDC